MKKKNLVDLELGSMNSQQFAMQMTEEARSVDPSFLEGISAERIRRYFFVGKGWRLTGTGFSTVARKYKAYASTCPANLVVTGKILLGMDESIKGPWFLRGSQIIVFDPNAHFELEILGGDMSKLVDFKTD